MGTFVYFGYGSNMLPQRLKRRCKSAVFIGVAYVEGYTLDFSKRSKDESGKATIVTAKDVGFKLFGTLYKINHNELLNLDRAEGPEYERDNNFLVRRIDDCTEVVSTTYIAKNCVIDSHLKPYDWYQKLVVAGARQGNLPESYIEWLEDFPSIPDPNTSRSSKALEILGSSDEQSK